MPQVMYIPLMAKELPYVIINVLNAYSSLTLNMNCSVSKKKNLGACMSSVEREIAQYPHQILVQI